MNGESWPVLGAFLALQSAITFPIVGFMVKLLNELKAEKDKRIADRDEAAKAKDAEIRELKAAHAEEVRDLKEKNEELMSMAFDAVRGFSSASEAARDTVEIVKQDRARRGVR